VETRIKSIANVGTLVGTGSTVLLAIYAIDLYFAAGTNNKIWFIILILVLSLLGFFGQILNHFLKEDHSKVPEHKTRTIFVTEEEKGIHAMTDTWTEKRN
jgi:hypothetical protein